MVGFVRTIFAQPDEAAARAQLDAVAERLVTSFPKAAEVLLAGEDDVLAYHARPTRALDEDVVDEPAQRVEPRVAGLATTSSGSSPTAEALLRLDRPAR
jgi:hypothetical protein